MTDAGNERIDLVGSSSKNRDLVDLNQQSDNTATVQVDCSMPATDLASIGPLGVTENYQKVTVRSRTFT